MSVVSELKDSRELLTNLTARELKGKYKGSVLGWGWSLVNPLATMAIYTLVFSFFLRVKVPVGERTGIKVFALWLLCGLLVWNFISNGMTTGVASLTNSSNLIKKVWFPRETLVLATVFALVVTLLIELGVLGVALVIAGNVVLEWLPAVVLLTVLLTMFVTGLALALSVANVYFRDLQYLISIGLQLWFYMTPIIYPSYLVYDQRGHEVLGVSIWTLYQLNPAFTFVESFRDCLYDEHFPSLSRLGYCAAWSVVSLLVGYWVFKRYEGRLAEEL
ncbi:MAG: transporter permease [Frankiales bacterium]|nr:transporter permease [Frankiales bacterium]